jgi:hypothetical protein
MYVVNVQCAQTLFVWNDFNGWLKSLHTGSIFWGTNMRQQAKQLKDYENAVIAKRLEELDEDEVRALVEEVEKDTF